ncbi:MAG: hypothetical protein A2103_04270 [Gammaproteobacteria bacterium GWF2_41_13]|nr:MAG: hypothetical protein A2103_04270 [Gammaproteobacteria bacterium GWF2_41_13]
MSIDIGIILTGTIVPNSTFVVHSDIDKRRLEYLEAIKFYKKFAPVYFLENSSYPLLSDPDFNDIKGVFLRKFPVSQYYNRGKGYQEFEMIKRWLETDSDIPRRFIKITGRYRILNFKDMFDECMRSQSNHFLIDRFLKDSKALTQLFYVHTDYYRALSDFYLDCNDENGDWAEFVLHKKMLALQVNSMIFRHEPFFAGRSGSTGANLYDGSVKHFVKSMVRKINRCLSKKYILFH